MGVIASLKELTDDTNDGGNIKIKQLQTPSNIFRQ